MSLAAEANSDGTHTSGLSGVCVSCCQSSLFRLAGSSEGLVLRAINGRVLFRCDEAVRHADELNDEQSGATLSLHWKHQTHTHTHTQDQSCGH